MNRLKEYFPVRLTLEEAQDGPWAGFKKAKGIFGECDKPTKNGRAYPRRLMEREIERLRPVMERRALFGELDHPTDGRTKLERASHIITNLEVDPDGRVIGEAVIMKTPRGQILEAIIEAGGEVGVSSRGSGDVKRLPEGWEEVQDNFVLKTYDFVGDPAMPTAIPAISEDVDDEFEWTPEVIEENYPGLFSQIESKVSESLLSEESDALKEAAAKLVEKAVTERESAVRSELEQVFSERLLSELAGVRESVTESVRSSLMEDPEVGGVKSVLSMIHEMTAAYLGESDGAKEDALRAAEVTVAELEQTNEELADRLRQTTYLLYAERQIAGHPMFETAQALLSDVVRCESLDEVSERVSVVLSDLGDVHEKNTVAERDMLSEEIEALRAERDEIQRQNESLVKSLRDAREASKGIAEQAVNAMNEVETLRERLESSELLAYRARASVGYVNAKELLALTEDADSIDDVDRVIAESGQVVVQQSVESREQIQQRLRRGASHDGSGMLSEENEVGSGRVGRGSGNGLSGRVQSLGTSIDEIRNIAGR